MDASTLYSACKALRDCVCDTAERISSAFEPPIELVEYITLPDHGQRVILRFGLVEKRPLSFVEADALESRLRVLAGSEYWTTLTSNYEERATDHDVGPRLTQIDQALPDDILRFCPTQHSARLRQDAHIVRGALDLTEDYLIWEIEVPVSDNAALTILRIIDTGEEGEGFSSRRTSKRAEVGDTICEAVFVRNNPSFSGCVKAYLMAQQRQMALNSYITQFEDLLT